MIDHKDYTTLPFVLLVPLFLLSKNIFLPSSAAKHPHSYNVVSILLQTITSYHKNTNTDIFIFVLSLELLKKRIILKNLIQMINHSYLLRRERLMSPFSIIPGDSCPPHKHIHKLPPSFHRYFFFFLPFQKGVVCKEKPNQTMECGVDRRQASLFSSNNKSQKETRVVRHWTTGEHARSVVKSCICTLRLL